MPDKPALDNPRPVPIRMAATNPNLDRKRAPGSGCQAFNRRHQRTTNPMPFVFEYIEVRYGEGLFAGSGDMTAFGRLITGKVGLGDEVEFPTVSGAAFVGQVLRFHESYDEWLGLPFYDWLDPEAIGVPFCIAVSGSPPNRDIIGSGVALGR